MRNVDFLKFICSSSYILAVQTTAKQCMRTYTPKKSLSNNARSVVKGPPSLNEFSKKAHMLTTNHIKPIIKELIKLQFLINSSILRSCFTSAQSKLNITCLYNSFWKLPSKYKYSRRKSKRHAFALIYFHSAVNQSPDVYRDQPDKDPCCPLPLLETTYFQNILSVPMYIQHGLLA